MNIENIAALANHLQQLGFGDMGNLLLKRICFKPDNFSITRAFEKGEDILQVELFVEKAVNEYVLKCYDIALLQKSVSDSQQINGIYIASLEKQMTTIDWKKAFDLNEIKPWNEKENFEAEETIETAIIDLAKLESSEEGKTVAATLKNKYWSGTNYYEIFGVITAPKIKAEISQRFFFFENQPGISLDEAYRFLQNKRMEKQLKRKMNEVPPANEEEGTEATGSGSGLLKKKRVATVTKKNKHKVTS